MVLWKQFSILPYRWFLNYITQTYYETSKSKSITVDWNQIINDGLGGRMEPDTYQLAVSNMLISSGHIMKLIYKKVTVFEIQLQQNMTLYWTNPPFGITGLKYQDFNHEVERSLFTNQVK